MVSARVITSVDRCGRQTFSALVLIIPNEITLFYSEGFVIFPSILLIFNVLSEPSADFPGISEDSYCVGSLVATAAADQYLIRLVVVTLLDFSGRSSDFSLGKSYWQKSEIPGKEGRIQQ